MSDAGYNFEQNRRVIQHEADTPMRGHDDDGGCCLRAKLGADEPKLKWVDLFGIDPGFTGDMTTEEYLAQSRGEA